MSINPPQSFHPSSLLPSYVQPEATQLLRPFAVVQQQQLKKATSWSALLQNLASRKAAFAFYALLAVVLVLFVAAGRAKPTAVTSKSTTLSDIGNTSMTATHTTVDAGSDSGISQTTFVAAGSTVDISLKRPVQDGSSRDGGSSQSSSSQARCAYGSLPGTWVSDAPAGARWQLLDPACPLINWLAVYAAAAGTSDSGDSSSTASEALPIANILLLSDSVDRYIVQHVCEHLHGVKHTIAAAQQHIQPTSEGTQHAPQPADGSPSDHVAVPAGPAAGPSNLTVTAYAFHTCQLPEGVPLKLASSYFPGVHPTGPFHRGLSQNYAARIQAAVAMWEEYAGAGHPPHVVSVASALWDVARLWMHERQQLEGPELSKQLLQSWVANFTAVVRYSQQQLPQAQLWLTHTTMLPAHDVTTGHMSKPYLGRRYFIEQLNAAAETAATQMLLQLVDYEALSSRFMEGQKYLFDLIHPNAEVALEVFNLMLNLAMQSKGM